jgi:Cu-Zn family superoxide dismutase
MQTKLAAIGVALVLACAGNAQAQKKKTVATATIDAKSGSKLKGKATFSAGDKGALTLLIEVSDAPPGVHAVHIHDKGDCSSPDGKSAVGADGKGTVTLDTTKWTAGGGGVNDVIGHAIVVHGGVDDFKTQPSGNAGPRIGCGVITK